MFRSPLIEQLEQMFLPRSPFSYLGRYPSILFEVPLAARGSRHRSSRQVRRPAVPRWVALLNLRNPLRIRRLAAYVTSAEGKVQLENLQAQVQLEASEVAAEHLTRENLTTG
jgi:hypothetical protein